MKKINQTKGILPLVLILAAVFIIEAVLSNFSFFAYVAGNGSREDYTPSVDNVVIYEGNRTVGIDIPSFPLNSVSYDLRINSIDNEDISVKVHYAVCDGNSASPFVVLTETESVGIEPKKVTAFLRSQGDAERLEISFDGNAEFVVSDVKINPSYTFGFNSLRFPLMYVFVCLIYVLKVNGNSRKLRGSLSYDAATTVSVFVCAFSAFAMWILNASGEDGNCIFYPIEGYLENQSPYIQQFDAFMKGQLHLDIQPSAELLALKNPYSPSERNGVPFLFDRAFYSGRYYSYFGIAPVVALYIPFYLISGFVPSDSIVTGIFSLITAVFLPLAVIEWSKLRGKNPPWLAAVCSIGAYFASSALLVQRGRASFYYIASIAAMAFLSIFLFFILKVFSCKKQSTKIICMALAGIGFAFAFLSRINSVLPVSFAIAVFIVIYCVKCVKNKKFSSFIGEMAALGLPVVAAIVFSLWYNNARFGNPLQFGTDYQLTVANASQYELFAGGFAASLYHYFLQPFVTGEYFPYIQFGLMRFAGYGRSMYIDSSFGLLAVPFMFSLLLSPIIFKSDRISKKGKILLAMSLLSLPITSFVNFCLGGVIFRYTTDIMLFAAFVSAVILIEFYSLMREKYGVGFSQAVSKGITLLTSFTAVLIFFVSISLNANLVAYDPDIYMAMREFFVFWS